MSKIGTLGEYSLHASLKQLYAQPDYPVEVLLEGWVVDVFTSEEIREIQTGNFGKMKEKLRNLLPKYRIRLVYPIAIERRVTRIELTGEIISQRRSPKKGCLEEVFGELVNLGAWVVSENFILEIVFVKDEVIWLNDGLGSWRKKGWRVLDRKLHAIVESRILQSVDDYVNLIPRGLPQPFTTRQLSQSLKIPVRLAGKMVYFLRQLGVLSLEGRKGRSYLYTCAKK